MAKKFRNGAKVEEKFEIRCIKARAGGTFEETNRFEMSTYRRAAEEADLIQKEFDLDCDPCRVYVHPVGSEIPIYAGLMPEVQRG